MKSTQAFATLLKVRLQGHILNQADFKIFQTLSREILIYQLTHSVLGVGINQTFPQVNRGHFVLKIVGLKRKHLFKEGTQGGKGLELDLHSAAMEFRADCLSSVHLHFL